MPEWKKNLSFFWNEICPILVMVGVLVAIPCFVVKCAHHYDAKDAMMRHPVTAIDLDTGEQANVYIWELDEE